MILWKFVTAALFSIFISYAVVLSEEETLYRVASKRFRFVNFKIELFHALDGKKIVVGYEETREHCLWKCLRSLECFSANICIHVESNGKVWCELMSSDKHTLPALSFQANESYHHYFIPNPCESSPCQNGGTCRRLNETNDYRCTCIGNYAGKNCERTSCVDQGWKSFKSTCYKYFDQVGKDRVQAKSHCQSFTSNLVMFKNADEQKFVINDVLPTHYGRVWIGLSRDSANKTVWRWDDGSPLTFAQWQHREPNRQDEDCAQMVVGLHYGVEWNDGWLDIHCHDSEGNPGFVCEREATVFSNP